MKSKRNREKILKKSLRERKRYLLLENVNKEKVEKAILDYIGILGYGRGEIGWVSDILAVNRDSVENIRAALELAKIKIKKVSGTLKKVKK